MRRPPLAALALFSLSTAALGAQAWHIPDAITKALADPARPKADTDRDALRKPAETIAFAGVKPGMTVGEFFPGGGYFTRLLSDVVGPKGHVYGIENAGWKGAVAADEKLLASGALKNVSIDSEPFGTVKFPAPLDIAWITQNYHDLKIAKYGKVDMAAFNKAVYDALKPGGTYLIVDHQAPRGATSADIAKLHRIARLQVIREVTAAGFRLINEGAFLRRPGDDHNKPIFDPAVRGHTDQFVLKFMKPPA